MPAACENDCRLLARLTALIEEARRNEEKFARFDEFEQRLMATRSLPDLVSILLEDYRQAFALDRVILYLHDREGEIASLYARLGRPMPESLRLLAHPEEIAAVSQGADAVTLGMPDSSLGIEETVASVARLPLRCGDEPLGMLVLGSHDPLRYPPGTGTRFLERLAAIAAICIDNALAHERLRHAGLSDGLTGVYNRRYFEDRCRVEVAEALRHHQPLSCLFLDLDHFKRINDHHGHQIGDEVLRLAARVMQKQLRAGDTLARYGGEEFVALLPQTPLEAALRIAERIRASVAAQTCRGSGKTVTLTLSIGVSTLDLTQGERERAATEMLLAADAALYRAKRRGRNRVESASAGEVEQKNLFATSRKAMGETRRRLAFLPTL